MENLSVDLLRKIILEEMQKMMQLEDALFSKDDLTGVGTGTVVGLEPAEDDYDDDWYSDYNLPDKCSKCGGYHSPSDPHLSHGDEDEIVGYIVTNI